MTMPTAPTPRRIGRPRWMDLRIIAGVILLVASVVIGAKVIGSSARTTPVWAATGDLAAGTVLDRGDLVSVEVNLGDSGGHYLAADSSVVGRVLATAVHAGELLPVSAIRAASEGRVVSISVSPERMPPGVTHGSVIDLYLTDAARASADEPPATRLVHDAVTVQSVTAPSSGGLSGAALSHYRIAVLLDPDDAAALVQALPGRDPLVVLRSAASDVTRESAPAASEQAGG